MRILYLNGQPLSSRNSTIIAGLRMNNVMVTEYSSHSRSYFQRYLKILFKYLLSNKKEFDLIFIGFFGQPLVPILRILSNKPIVLDALISSFDTMCYDRKVFTPESFRGRFFYWLDKTSCKLADKVLLDTNEHINYFVNTFSINRQKFRRIFVGADSTILYPRNAIDDNKFIVFYYGSFLPLQGIDIIIIAAKILEPHNDILFKIIGKGMESKKIKNMVYDLNLKNIEFIDWVPYNELADHISHASICLGGHFSNIEKAKKVISGKTFHFIAMKKPVIIGDNPANRELFEDGKSAVFVEHGNPEALAFAILELKDNKFLCKTIAEGGYQAFKEKCTHNIIGKEIKSILEELIKC